MSSKPGIRRIHSRRCDRRGDPEARCNCRPTWEASVFDARTGRKLRRQFKTEAAARGWRVDTMSGVRRGSVPTTGSPTVRAATDLLLAGMESGAIRNRSGDIYKPSVVAGYRRMVARYILPFLGARRIADVRRAD